MAHNQEGLDWILTVFEPAVLMKRVNLQSRRSIDTVFFKYIDQGNLVRAKTLVRRALRQSPSDHDLWFKLGFAYHCSREFRRALKATETGLKFAPSCPLLQVQRADHLGSLKQYRAGINAYNRVLRRGVQSVEKDPCNEGHEWAKALVNDCRFGSANLYRVLGMKNKAKKLLKVYLIRRIARRSVYPQNVINRVIKELTQGDN